ncbi:hypothetical protein V8C86DRAFT_3023522 [Haematococcus lacustris]
MTWAVHPGRAAQAPAYEKRGGKTRLSQREEQEGSAQLTTSVCGDSYPLGCRFDLHIFGAQFFLANPDKRRRMYQTQLGIYQARCGLRNVLMSWGSQEYLFLVLLLNSSQLPYEALFLLRHLRFTALTRPGNTYQALLSPEDEALMPLLRAFQRLTAYQRVRVNKEPVNIIQHGVECSKWSNLPTPNNSQLTSAMRGNPSPTMTSWLRLQPETAYPTFSSHTREPAKGPRGAAKTRGKEVQH